MSAMLVWRLRQLLKTLHKQVKEVKQRGQTKRSNKQVKARRAAVLFKCQPNTITTLTNLISNKISFLCQSRGASTRRLPLAGAAILPKRSDCPLLGNRQPGFISTSVKITMQVEDKEKQTEEGLGATQTDAVVSAIYNTQNAKKFAVNLLLFLSVSALLTRVSSCC